MKFASPNQRGSACRWICPATPAPAARPRFIPRLSPSGLYKRRRTSSACCASAIISSAAGLPEVAMNTRVAMVVAVLFAFGTTCALAQGTMGGIVSTGGGAPGVAKVPYSADTIIVSDRVLADGNHIHRETHGRVYRDSQGR